MLWGILPDGRTGLSCNRSSQSLSVLKFVHMYILFYNFSPRSIFSYTIFFFVFFFLDLQSRLCTADSAYCSYIAQTYNHSLEN